MACRHRARHRASVYISRGCSRRPAADVARGQSLRRYAQEGVSRNAARAEWRADTALAIGRASTYHEVVAVGLRPTWRAANPRGAAHRKAFPGTRPELNGVPTPRSP